jgi:hypothetical protein
MEHKIELFDSIKVLEKIEKASSIVTRDSAKAKDYWIGTFWIQRDYPLTDWETKRNERIHTFLLTHRDFKVHQIQEYVWREKLLTNKYKTLSPFIENFTQYMLSELERLGFLEREWLFIAETKDEKLHLREIQAYKVIIIPNIEVIHGIARRRILMLVDVPEGSLA